MSVSGVLPLSIGSPEAPDSRAAPSPPALTNAALPGEDKQRAVTVPPESPEVAKLATAYPDVLPVRERSGDDKLAVRLPTPALVGEGVFPPVVATRSRSGGPAIPPAVLANWNQDIAFLSSGNAEAVTRGLAGLMRADNTRRPDDPGAYLTSVRDEAFVGRAYGQELIGALGIGLADILGDDKAATVFIPALDGEKLKALVGATGRLTVRMLESDSSVSVFGRAGRDYLKAVGTYATMVADQKNAPAEARNKALTTLYVNSLFLRGVSAALNEAAVGDRRIAVVAGLVQGFANGAGVPHRQVSERALLDAYVEQRDAVQDALHAALKRLEVPFVAEKQMSVG